MDILATYLRDAARIPRLDEAETRRLIAEAQAGSIPSRNRVIEANLKLVVNIARLFPKRGIPIEDLISEGNRALFHAVQRFNLYAGFQFSTYAVHCINGYIRKAFRHGTLIRIPAYLCTALDTLHRGGSVDKINRDFLKIAANVLQGKPVPIGDMPERPPYDSLAGSEEYAHVEKAMKLLTKRELLVLTLRFGLDGQGERTFAAIAPLIGASSSQRAHQIKKSALTKLRIALNIEERPL